MAKSTTKGASAPKPQKKGQVLNDLTGHNGGSVSPAVILGYDLQLAKDEEAIKKLQDQIKTIKKKTSTNAKNDGVDLELVAFNRKRRMKSKSAQVEEHNKMVHYARAQHLDIAPQLTLIDLMKPDNSAEANHARAKEYGRQAGIVGKDRDSLRDSYEPGSEFWQSAIDGWNEGQDLNKEALLAMASPSAPPAGTPPKGSTAKKADEPKAEKAEKAKAEKGKPDLKVVGAEPKGMMEDDDFPDDEPAAP